MKKPIPTPEQISAIMQLKKQVIREMEWTERLNHRKFPIWKQFESYCTLGTTDNADVIFRAHYRPPFTASDTPLSEILYLSLSVGNSRIFAIDMHEGQMHKNKTGKGLPYYGKTVTSTVHKHIWIDNNSNYVEPVFLDETTVETVFSEFTEQALLFLNGDFVHPMHNEQLLLLS